MRETGRPEVSMHSETGTREQAARNRENVESAFRSALLRHSGNIRINISWDVGSVSGKCEDLACCGRDAGAPTS